MANYTLGISLPDRFSIYNIRKEDIMRKIPIFFASDDNYAPILSVAIRSIEEHASVGNIYEIRILTEGLTKRNRQRLLSMRTDSLHISIVNVNEALMNDKESIKATLRDYYSESIFYRIFIASLFPEMKKAIYIDCDVVLLDDIAKLYDVELGDKILGAVADESIPRIPAFSAYTDRWVGVPPEEYINSGVLLINLDSFRKENIEGKITYLLNNARFMTLAPDQDYLNFLCRGRIKYLSEGWNKQPIEGQKNPSSDLHLVHYNMFTKPWRYRGVLYEEEFWNRAKNTPYNEELDISLATYTEADRSRDLSAAEKLVESAQRMADNPGLGFAEYMERHKEKEHITV